MLRYLLLFFVLFITGSVYAQFSDNFNDGDFTNNPTWQGDLTNFLVNSSLELQLNDTAGGISQIVVPLAIGDSTTWEFMVRLDFAPSNTNRVKVYLSSTSADLANALDGYFIQIGEGGTNDAVVLYKQSGTNNTQLIRATDGSVGSQPALARIQVIRNDVGDWQLWTDYTGGNNFVLEGTATDNAFPVGNYFGFFCKYSSTRKDKFFFDDVTISPLFVDVTPPTLLDVVTISNDSLLVIFDEALAINSAESPNNYLINNGIGTPITAKVSATNPNNIVLKLGNSLTSGQNYTLTTNQIADLIGNVSTSQSKNFTFYNIQPALEYDILINEILADPAPSVALPEAEFIELYNNSNKTIQLSDLTFTNGTDLIALPAHILLPNEYVIICRDDNAPLFSNFGTVKSVSSLPALVNSGDNLVLATANNTVIHEVNYDQSWYQDASKDNGGWTLELINPNLACQGATNWIASNHPSGGTPAQQNSVFNNSPDNNAPSLVSLQASESDTVWLTFDEAITENTAQVLTNYSINKGIGSPNQAILQPDQKTVLLVLNNALQDNTTYTLTVNQLADCSGNAINALTKDFTFVQTFLPQPFDILITEFLTDPFPSIGLPEAEFVELYNNSDLAVNLSDLTFENQSTTINLPSYILLPKEYVILYDNIFSTYPSFGNTLLLDALPSLNNSQGTLTLATKQNTIIHHLEYDATWYQNSSKSNGGWSLEMKDIQQPCLIDIQNWQASDNLIGGTPGTVNSISTTLEPIKLDVLKAVALTPFILELTFNQSLNADLANDFSNYAITEGLNIIDAQAQAPLYNRVFVTTDQVLQPNTIYEITLTNLTSCIGSALGMFNTVRVGLSEPITAQDIVINELLFNPFSDGKDFVELYNRSNKIIDVSDLILGNITDGFPSNLNPIEVPHLLFPNDYLVLTSDVANIKTNYITTNLRGFVQIDLPSFPDQEGGVVLLSSGTVIDQFIYTDDWHHQQLDDKNGVSLERINPSDTTQSFDNWHSAAVSVGYATPAYQNSQFLQTSVNNSELITLSSKTFSPDSDGFEDFLLINYELPQTGYSGTITIYDSKGRLIKNLINNEILGAKGSFKWDGISNNETKANIGIYILFIELIHPNGNIERMKKTCVLANKL